MAGKSAATGQVGTPGPQASPMAARASNNRLFLQYAPKVPLPVIQATLPTGQAGGSNSIYTFSELIPAIPVWATDLLFFNYVNVQISSPGSGTFVVSPFAPYCMLSSQLTLAGSPPWNLMEHTPWALDHKRWRGNYDPYYIGLGQYITGGTGAVVINPATNAMEFITDLGPNAYAAVPVPGSLSLPVIPGTTVTNGATSAVTFTHGWQWVDRVRLQRNPALLAGCVPLGDPENRPRIKLQLNTLVNFAGASQPQACPYVNATAATTAQTFTNTAITNLIIRAARLDVLPSGVSIPTPQVGMGVTVNNYQVSITTAGQIQQYLHQQSMLYTAVEHLTINAGIAQESDYFGLWLTQEQRSNRWEYDQSQNTYQPYFEQFFERYRRYPERGWLSADFDRGELPELPALTPYDAFMTPDFGYANMFGVVPTPNMTTANRIPSGVGLTNAYEQIYEFGLVNVPY